MRGLLPLLLMACADPVIEPVSLTVDAGADVSVSLGRTVTLQATGNAAEYTWTLGDGTVLTGQQVEHNYSQPGNYGVVVQGRADNGETRSDSLVVTAYPAPAAVRPSASSALAVDEAQQVGWVAIAQATALHAVDMQTGEVAAVTSCDGPRTVAMDAGRVWVTCEHEDVVRVVDAQTRRLQGTYQLVRGARPYAVVARDGIAYVTAQGTGQLIRIEPGGSPAIQYSDLGADPRALVWLPDGALWATRFRGDGVGRVYRASDSDLVLERSQELDSDTRNRGVPALLQSLAPSPDGQSVVVGGQLSNTDRGTYRDGRDLTFETTVRAMTRGVDTTTGLPIAVYDRQLNDHGHAGPVTFGPLGAQLYVAHPHSGIIQILDGWTTSARGSLLDAGLGITGLVPSSDGERLWVLAEADRQLVEYELADRVNNPLPVRRWAAVADEPLTPQALRGLQLFHDAADTRLAKDGYIACASCHPDGRDDGLVWDFTGRGEGLRNTTSLEGRVGMGMGPLHWTGNFDEVQDFEHDIRHGNAGSGLISDAQFDAAGGPMGESLAGLSEDLDALAAYLATFDRTPTSPAFLTTSSSEEAVFRERGCDSCHAGPLFTDSAVGVRHDIGTAEEGSGSRLGEPLDGFDTPTLLGVWATAPYLHDGSASTLSDAITAHALDGEPLSDDELAALVRFVESL